MRPPTPAEEICRELPFDELLPALRSGDHAIWTRVFDRLLPSATAAVRRAFGAAVSRADNAGGEAVASACRTFYRNITDGNFDLECWSDLSGLFIRITLNKCVDKLRVRGRMTPMTDLVPAHALEECQTLLVELPARDPLPLDEVLRREAGEEFKRIVDLVRRRLKRKSKEWRAIFNLKLEGMDTTEQIARKVGCSENSVKRVWRDAVEMLRKLQDGSLDEDETPPTMYNRRGSS